MRNITELFRCGKCQKGIVKRTLKETKNDVEVKIHKCDNNSCKHQYGIKGINELTSVVEVGTE